MSIQNPNASGQGHDPDHAKHPCHWIVEGFGYRYSHTTMVDGKPWHTYSAGEHRVTLFGNLWSTKTTCASGHRFVASGDTRLREHLQNKRRRYPELRKQNIAATHADYAAKHPA